MPLTEQDSDFIPSTYDIRPVFTATLNVHGRLAMWIKWRACAVGEAKEELENELWRR